MKVENNGSEEVIIGTKEIQECIVTLNVSLIKKEKTWIDLLKTPVKITF